MNAAKTSDAGLMSCLIVIAFEMYMKMGEYDSPFDDFDRLLKPMKPIS